MTISTTVPAALVPSLRYIVELEVVQEAMQARYPNQRVYISPESDEGFVDELELRWESKDPSTVDNGNFGFRMSPKTGRVIPTEGVTHPNDWSAADTAIARHYREVEQYS